MHEEMAMKNFYLAVACVGLVSTAACSDADGNLTTCELVSGPGSFNG